MPLSSRHPDGWWLHGRDPIASGSTHGTVMLTTRLRTIVSVSIFALVAPALLAQESAAPKLTRLAIEAADLVDWSEWHGVYMFGKKVGHAHLSGGLQGEGEARSYVGQMVMQCKMTMLGETTEMKLSQIERFAGTAPFAFLGGNYEDTSDGETSTTEVKRSGDGFVVALRAEEVAVDKELASIDYELSDMLSPRVWMRQKPEERAILRLHAFDSDSLAVSTMTFLVKSQQESIVNGVGLRYWDLDVSDSREGDQGRWRLDAAGTTLSMKLGQMLELRLEGEAKAKSPDYTGDLFVLGSTKIDKKLGDPSDLTRLVVRAKGKNVTGLRSGPGQVVVQEAGGTALITIDPSGAPAVIATEAEIRRSLEDNLQYPITDPQIVALARTAIDDATTPRAKVDRLVHFVAEFLEDSYVVADHPSVLRTIKVKKGDCSDHASLFVTLSRAVGVPAREASGLIYVGDDQKSFGGHAWSEVVLDGAWVPVDATWDEVKINAAHLRLSAEGTDVEGMQAMVGMRLSLVEAVRK